MQLFIPGIEDAFVLVEQALQETFIPAVLQGLGEITPGRGVTRLFVNGGFFGFRAAKNSWMAEKVQGWSESVKTPMGVFCKHS